MEFTCISQTTANLIMDAMRLSYLKLADSGDGIEWTERAFMQFCEIKGIDLIMKDEADS